MAVGKHSCHNDSGQFLRRVSEQEENLRPLKIRQRSDLVMLRRCQLQAKLVKGTETTFGHESRVVLSRGLFIEILHNSSCS